MVNRSLAECISCCCKFEVRITHHTSWWESAKIGDGNEPRFQTVFEVVNGVGDVIRHIHNLALEAALLAGAGPLDNPFDKWLVIRIKSLHGALGCRCQGRFVNAS